MEIVPQLQSRAEQNTLEDRNKSCRMCPLVLSVDGRLKRQFVISELVLCVGSSRCEPRQQVSQHSAEVDGAADVSSDIRDKVGEAWTELAKLEF